MPTFIRHLCPTCGANVIEHRGQLYDNVQPMLLTMGSSSTDTPTLRHVYLPHDCDPARIDEYANRVSAVVAHLTHLQENLPELEVGQADYIDALQLRDANAEELSAMTVHYALTEACPRCDAPKAQPCLNLTERRAGRQAYTKHPHKERLPAPETAGYLELEALREQLFEANTHLSAIEQALTAEDALTKLTQLAQRLC